ncbi:hypothetical protein H8S90_04515 [Olivibacter sp. SDN3]|uniref:hypothetical protein n=1 Tax=Olivibacter sp. SDN3 TaxID=2764720 RepID=UPI001651A80A|nr:hypothetical protein [Olivibacter sp. SDN3]QNL50859.1 hypothetical protein H8S90_04515 [Olivibacter sp. SDN3]
MSLFKIINIIVLIGFVNTTTYFPCYINDNLLQYVDVSEAQTRDFDGDTLLECFFDDVLDLPMSGSDYDPDIFFDNYNFLVNIIDISIKVLDSFILTVKPILCSLMSSESYFVSKTTPLLGYYTFLFRLKPF